MKNTGNFLGDHIAFYLPILDGVKNFFAENTFLYGFYPPENFGAFIRDNPADGAKLYWEEILMMAHMASATSLLRSYHWLNAICDSINNKNQFGFASNLRGFLEAASDTYDAMGPVPETLIQQKELISLILSKRGKTFATSAQLEAKLIHFLQARELLGESAPESHKVKKTAEYFESVDREKRGPVRKLYHVLCEISHPSEASVTLFLDQQSNGYRKLCVEGKYDIFADVHLKHSDAVVTAFSCGINIALISLKVLNEFPLEKYHTPILDNSRFDVFPMGERIKRTLKKTTW
jgi:hypothetical protein